MTWNHRVVTGEYKVDPPELIPGGPHVFYELREVYYDVDGKPDGWTGDASEPVGDTTRELLDDLVRMTMALVKPILDDTGKEVAPAPFTAAEIRRAIDSELTRVELMTAVPACEGSA